MSHTSGARTDLFDEARRAVSVEDLVARAGVKLVRAGRELRGPCPICGSGSKSKSMPFAVNPEKQTFRAYCGCDMRGDVTDLERALGGGDLVDAARRLTGGEYRSAPRTARERPAEPQGPTVSERIAADMWDGAWRAKPDDAPTIWGTLAERYLLARGIAPEIVNLAARNLRFHPRAKYAWDGQAGAWVTAPAMLVQVVTAAGPTGGIHATYLANNPPRKAALTPAKRMWGRQTDAEGRPGGAWLIGPGGFGNLAVAEGIETALSVATLALRDREHFRVCAALSLNRLQGGVMRDADGCEDVFDPQPNPARPPFVWPRPESGGWRRVMVAVDRDMSPVKVKGRTGRGKIVDFERGPEERAALCARLAVSAWKAAGAPEAVALRPPPGRDFNDELRRVLARESAT